MPEMLLKKGGYSYKVFVGLLILLFTGKVELIAQSVPKIRIDPQRAFGGYISNYFNEIEYVPLETTKECLFGDVSQLVITDSSIVVFDYDTKSVLFFSANGKFKTKLKVKETPQLFIADNKIGVRTYNRVTNSTKINYYSQTGTDYYQEETVKGSVNEGPVVILDRECIIRPGSCYFPIGAKLKDSTYHLLQVYKNNELWRSFLPYNQSKDIGFCAFMGSIGDLRNCIVQNKAVYVCTGGDYSIYKITKDTISKMYQFVFPASRTYPGTYINIRSQTSADSIRKMNLISADIIRGVSNIFFGERTLHFRLDPAVYINSTGSDYNSQYNFIYDTLTGKLVCLERITPDNTNFYLPFMEPIKIAMNGFYFRKGYFYSVVSSFQMFASEEKNKSRTPQYPPALQEYFKTQNRKSNPVIVKMKLKE
jgi:hypothetical protein